MKRAAFFVDGFNLYHALKRLDQPKYKWLDLKTLSQNLIAPKSETLQSVYYFSALAHWLPDQKRRHEAYIKALQSTGVINVMGQFKNKSRGCFSCGAKWIGHEEKETDVNIAIWLLNEAYRDSYDRAYIVSRDSDMVPAIRMVREIFPHKEIVAVAPPHMGHSNDIISVATDKKKITIQQLERSLFAAQIRDDVGHILVNRPREYDPT